jgi:biotin operon repressor
VLRTQFCFVCLCLATGQPLSQRAMAERFGLSRRRVSQLVTQVTASGNSHQHESEAA